MERKLNVKTLNIGFVLVIGLFVSVGVARAACSGLVCSDVLVERLYVNANGVVYVATDGVETTLNCSPVSNIYLTLYHTDANFNAIYSTLLAAQLAGEKVGIRIIDGSSNCRVSYITID